MAATSFDIANAAAAPTSNSNPSFVFDVYDDDRAAGAAHASSGIAPSLPTGPCNFIDLTNGSSGPQCGCRRFWSRGSVAAATPVAASFGASVTLVSNGALDLSQAGWCMCSHHACFHDQAPQQALLQSNFPTDQPGVVNGATVNGLAASLPGMSVPLLGPLYGQENERPRTNREPLSPLQDSVAFQILAEQDAGQAAKINENSDLLSFGMKPVNLSSYTERLLTGMFDEQAMAPRPAAERPAAPTPAPPSLATSIAESVVGHTPFGNSIPDTLSCGPYDPPLQDGLTMYHSSLRSQQGTDGCLLPLSQAPPSTTSSVSQSRYLRPFAGKGLRTLAHTPTPSPLKPQPPSQPEQTAITNNIHDSVQDTASTQPGLHSLVGAVQAHEQRLEKLENVSFSVPSGQEEWGDRHDHMDMRVTELESRVDEVEKRLSCNDETASGAGGSIILSRRRLLGRDDDATTVSAISMAATDVATSMTSSSSAAVRESDMVKQIHALQDQVNLLQASALPTYNSPWELEVVFLPFLLKGVWVEASQFPSTAAIAAAAAAQRRQSGGISRYHSGHNEDDEWTQMPNTLSRQTPDPQSPNVDGTAGWASSDWPDFSATSDVPRLLPRACAPGRVIDNRLRSCGLVKTLSVRGADARSLQLAVATAFGPVFRAMAQGAPLPSRAEWNKTSNSSPSGRVPSVPSAEALQAQFLGLQQPWVPLRKIHKDSRLRFLTRAEMLTPSLWDTAFLTASVVMKATGRQRLYVTHPDAYMQDRHAYRCGWSWQRLREVTATLGSSSGNSNSSTAPSIEAADPCWSWDSRLDEPPSAPQSSLSSGRNRPSPSPFSREGTPTGARFVRHRSRTPSHLAGGANASGRASVNASANANAGTGLSRSQRSSGASGSTQQFFTVAQSPLLAADWAGTTARRSPSPFFSLVPQSAQPALSSPLMSSSRRSRRPTPIRTVSMPAPPPQSGRPGTLAGAVSSPATAGRRRVQSASSHLMSSSPSSRHLHQRQHHRQHTTVSTMAYERRPSPLASTSRPSPRFATLPSPVINNGSSAVNTAAAVGVTKRRRSTRSPSGFWPRYTPRRSMSRSPSVPPIQAPTWSAGGAGGHGRELNQQQGPAYQHARGATPFCYATPHSNAPTTDAPLSASNRRRRGSAFLAETEWVGNDETGSIGYDHDMLGDGMDDYDGDGDDGDNDDFPMTQDDDSDDEGEYEIDVYEDEADELDEVGNEGADTDNYLSEPRQLLPEDEPWPGIDDNEGEANGDHGDEDAHMANSENMDPFSGETDSGLEEGGPEQQQEQYGQHSQALSQPSDSSSQPSEYPSTHPAWPVAAATSVGTGAEATAEAAARGAQLQGQQGELSRRQLSQNTRHDGGHLRRRRETDADSGIGFVIHEDMDNGPMRMDR